MKFEFHLLTLKACKQNFIFYNILMYYSFKIKNKKPNIVARY